MTGLRSLPFHQMPAQCSLCSTNNGQGDISSGGRWLCSSKGCPTTTLCHWHWTNIACRSPKMSAVSGNWQSLASKHWAPAELGWHQHGQWFYACSDVHSPPFPFLWIFVGMEEQPLLLGIDYFSLSSLIISDAHWFKCCCFLLLFTFFSPIPSIFMMHKVRVVIILYLHGLSCLHHLLASKW